MRSLEVVPCAALRPYVRLIWLFELDEPAAFGPAERVTPDGLLEVVFHSRTPFACRYDGQGFAAQPRSVAVSQTRRFVEIRPRGPSGLVSVRFHPWGAYHFFRVPLSELADQQVPIDVLWDREASELETRLAESSGDLERVALVERFLLIQLRRHHKADVEPLVRTIWNRRGQGGVSELCRELGIGERRLQRLCASSLGTTPKGFARLVRFLHACRLLRNGGAPTPYRTLAELGHACGYYDQSHFGAEFKEFTGMTPGQFVRAEHLSFLDSLDP